MRSGRCLWTSRSGGSSSMVGMSNKYIGPGSDSRPHLAQSSELLGFQPGARILIVNNDDLGMYHAINEAVIHSIQDGIASSCSLMVPCPWASHAMGLLRERPWISFGIHLTLVRDMARFGWGPLTDKEKVPSLLDEAGEFFLNDRRSELLSQARIDEIEVELRAQIDAVVDTGLRPTHLDWHCLADGGRDDVFDLTLALAKEYGLAARLARAQPPQGAAVRLTCRRSPVPG